MCEILDNISSELDDFWISISYDYRTIEDQGFPENFFTAIFATIEFHTMDDESEDIGHFHLTRFRVEDAILQGYCIGDMQFHEKIEHLPLDRMFDMESFEFTDEFIALASVNKAGFDILLLEFIFIKRKYRGYKLLDLVMKEIWLEFRRSSKILITQIYPPQFGYDGPSPTSKEYQKFSKKLKTAKKKLTNHFYDCGFFYAPEIPDILLYDGFDIFAD
ncbi:hypothetical protein [Leeuwenhoekiella parthenopeia]|uniref:Uncharacterized protein n=1 Tax=Leeuwenhoekiella parthenopeia TaxID=2890320 RepID=A0ABS8GN35_9FLAO|nr:hypothetical protein [Leeuwenhoekiella parthenopeia]MCC4211329.1 hypothetical protein [Leeuwenhoekiella parthenopeia]